MADVVKLVSGDGTTVELALATDDLQLLVPGWEMGAPEHDNTFHDSPYEDGERLVRHKKKNRIWPVKLLVGEKGDASAADKMGNAFTKLARIIRQAREYQRAPVESGEYKVWLHIKLDGATNATYYDVVDLETDGLSLMETLSRIREDAQASFRLTTKPWGYGDEVTLVNNTEIKNCLDDNDDNYVDITGVKGDLPTPATIEVHNDGANSESYASGPLWIAKRNRPDYNIDIVLDDSEANSILGSPTPVTGSDYVHGQYSPISVGGGTSWTEIAQWTLTASTAKRWGGRFAPLVIAQSALDAGIKLRARVTVSTTEVSRTSEATVRSSPAQQIVALGMLEPQPGLPIDGGNPYDYKLRLECYNESSTTIDLDCIQLMPLDGYRIIDFIYSLELDATVIDNGHQERLYVKDNSGVVYVATQNGLGKQIVLVPGKSERLYFLIEAGDHTYNAQFVMNVTVKYRPRTEFLLGTS